MLWFYICTARFRLRTCCEIFWEESLILYTAVFLKSFRLWHFTVGIFICCVPCQKVFPVWEYNRFWTEKRVQKLKLNETFFWTSEADPATSYLQSLDLWMLERHHWQSLYLCLMPLFCLFSSCLCFILASSILTFIFLPPLSFSVF